jgi:hypothetical protein
MSDEILHLNQLDYSQPFIMNPSKSTDKIDIPINPNRFDECVGGEQIQILFENLRPCCFIDGYRSTLSLQLQVNVPIPVNDPDMWYYAFDLNESRDSGASIINLFQDAIHRTENNQILYHEKYFNIMQTFRNYRISNEHRQNLTMIGTAPPEISFSIPTYPYYNVNRIISFDIPLSTIPFFNTGQLIPSELLQKSALYLTVADPKLSLIGKNKAASSEAPISPSITVSFMNMSLRLHTTQLYDNIHSAIKSSQLEFPYLSNHNILYQPTSSSFVIPVNLAASKTSYIAIKFAQRVRVSNATTIGCAGIRDIAGSNSDDNGLGGLRIIAKVGEMFIPKFHIDTAVQSYISTCDALDKVPFKNTENPDPLKTINQLASGTIPYNNYCVNKPTGSTYTTGNSTGCFCIAINLEKYGNLSGVSTNANRLLALHIDGLTGFQNFDVYVQTQYMSNVSMMENNIIVSK